MKLGAQNHGTLHAKMNELKHGLRPEHRQFLLKSAQELKKSIGAETLLKTVWDFNEVVPPLVASLKKKVDSLLRMQAAQATKMDD